MRIMYYKQIKTECFSVYPKFYERVWHERTYLLGVGMIVPPSVNVYGEQASERDGDTVSLGTGACGSFECVTKSLLCVWNVTNI